MSLFPEGDISGLRRNGCNYHLITIFLCRFLCTEVELAEARRSPAWRCTYMNNT